MVKFQQRRFSWFGSSWFILILISLTRWSSDVAAQEIRSEAKNIKPVFDVGLFGNSTLVRDQNTAPMIGMGGHVYINVVGSDRVAFQMGLAYSTIRFRKHEFASTQLQYLEDAEFAIRYLSLPFNLTIYLDKRKKIQLRTGIFAEMLTRAQYSGLKTYYVPSQGWVQAYTTERPNMKSANAGIEMGCFYQIFGTEKMKIRLGGSVFCRPIGVSNQQFPFRLSTVTFGTSILFCSDAHYRFRQYRMTVKQQ